MFAGFAGLEDVMHLYEVVTFVHIAAAVGLLSGSVVSSPGVRAAVRRARTTQELRAYVSIGRSLLLLEPASAMVLLASGIYLTSAAGFWNLSWVQVAVAFWVVNAIVAGALVKPAIGRVADLADASADGPVGPALNGVRWSSRWSIGGDVLMANDAAMLYLMTMKPELSGSLLVVAATNFSVAAARVVSHGLRGARPHPARAAARTD
jgi:hypothetical protein